MQMGMYCSVEELVYMDFFNMVSLVVLVSSNVSYPMLTTLTETFKSSSMTKISK